MLISSSSRYSIYKVQWSVLASLSLARTSISYHIFSHLSRTFSKFFDFQLSLWLSLAWRLLNFTHPKPFVKNYFSFFFKLFESCFSIFQSPQATFICYHSSVHLSRTFFISFQIHFCVSLPPRGQLAYTSTGQFVCQARIFTFRKFFPGASPVLPGRTSRVQKGRAEALPSYWIVSDQKQHFFSM